MRDVQIYRKVLNTCDEQVLRTLAQGWIEMTEQGHHTAGRIYDDLWPLNLAGVEAVGLPLMFERIVDRYAKQMYPQGYTYSNAFILCTTRYPYQGTWHRDAPPYEDDTIALLCVDGCDELEYHQGGAEWVRWQDKQLHSRWTGDCAKQYADLQPGDLCLLPAATWHRGRCTTQRITWHVRVGPQGHTFQEQHCGCALPEMSVKRFLRRTIGTAGYYLLGNPRPWQLLR